MRNIKLGLWYCGKRYSGFQQQVQQRTVAGDVLKALSALYNEPIHLVAAGRTDAGVHAVGQVVNYHTEQYIPCDGLKKGLNALLPEDTRVLDVSEVPLSFHARYSAKKRTYHFLMSRELHGYLSDYVETVSYGLDFECLEHLCKLLVGRHDFKFLSCKTEFSCQTEREIYECSVEKIYVRDLYHEVQRELIRFKITANSFLYKMVRNILGAMMEVMRGKQSDKDFKKMLLGKKQYSYTTMSPKGLTLVNVEY
ncbi:tRNA pseudouridine(38-40) synthase TruA [Candidatus Marinamargulisbacteria bacterium SCGC AG-439-L15]|nr:tRNA pseudouridine(38-40) synthase TruA [Candidatus Marinamargulisbacteria bacterium SCGC AG-439-L15]